MSLFCLLSASAAGDLKDSHRRCRSAYLALAALGAAIGGGMPLTRQEQRRLSGMGGKAREFVDSHKDQLASQLRDKKDQLVEQADTAISKPNSGGEGEMENHAEMTMPTTTQA